MTPAEWTAWMAWSDTMRRYNARREAERAREAAKAPPKAKR